MSGFKDNSVLRAMQDEVKPKRRSIYNEKSPTDVISGVSSEIKDPTVGFIFVYVTTKIPSVDSGFGLGSWCSINLERHYLAFPQKVAEYMMDWYYSNRMWRDRPRACLYKTREGWEMIEYGLKNTFPVLHGQLEEIIAQVNDE